MGELAKKIGEKGEKLVSEFLQVIGWDNFQDGESIACCYPEKHKSPTAKGNRKTHGIDVFYSFRSQLQDYTLENIVLSVKYTKDPYPANPSTKFKEHLKDLAQTVDCFMKSELRSDNNEQYEMTGIQRANDTGVLFWLSNHKESDQDIVSKIANIHLDKSLNFSTVHIVDNSRASFIYDSIQFIRNNFREFDYSFHHVFSSSNYQDPKIEKHGQIMPVEYLTSNLLPFRFKRKGTEKEYAFCISCREEFSEEVIHRLLTLASDISQEFTEGFVFLFPDYDQLNHESILKKALRLRSEGKSSLDVTVKSYKSDFRNLINE